MPITYRLRSTRGDYLALDSSQLDYLLYSANAAGIAPVQHITQQGVYQNGETVRDVRTDPRTLQFGIDIMGDEPEDMPALRDALYAMLAPDYLGCYIEATREDGSRRDILARKVGALEMPEQVGNGFTRQRVVVTMRAGDPYWYDPMTTVWAYSVGGGSGLWSFPLGFSRGFGASTIDRTETRQYLGTVPAFPVITLTGPLSDLIIENVTTGEKLDFEAKSYDIGDGETVVIDLRPRIKTATSSVDGSIEDELSDDSDLGTFHIERRPEASGGRNTMHITASGCTAASAIIFRFNTLYAGI